MKNVVNCSFEDIGRGNGKSFPFDYEINWDKKNHAVEVAFLLGAKSRRDWWLMLGRASAEILL